MLLKASTSSLSDHESKRAVLQVLKDISGPFAFVYFDKAHNVLYFGRDRLGRRSLLYNTDSSSQALELASIADPSRGLWEEVEADAIYMTSLSANQSGERIAGNIDCTTPQFTLPIGKELWDQAPSLGSFNRNMTSGILPLQLQSPSVAILRKHLVDSLRLRILNVLVPPSLCVASRVRIAVLFSGGLDCTVLARLTHELLPLDQEIDLLNVAFENPRVVQAAKNARKPGQLEANTLDPFESCPDRQTGRRSFQELQDVCPTRIWRFVAINVPFEELKLHKPEVIDLIRPHNTEMDLSIAYALYFAARGMGVSYVRPSHYESETYTTSARVLLSGLGADELFGGYTRHATAFERRGYSGLLGELELDINRLGKRNLGRDDRVISHWGREARFPFLDENLVKWAIEAPIWEKCGFIPGLKDVVDGTDSGLEPSKKVLRLLAFELGLASVSKEKKRAIQFGARTAKMETGRTKGTSLIS
ncbi:hypothetical protein BP6252_06172 [Coleophoma cylindrospora]|uniref:Glutamine amidotransferase type-2 domain-containing protein n=1 Tax=Coleophoma cylindrospora TaxID=1849047 RepID=A0A3D8RM52_9HELO|nr:hypothetical protein BP6252_06172 [Coleophoma cylindrospora]